MALHSATVLECGAGYLANVWLQTSSFEKQLEGEWIVVMEPDTQRGPISSYIHIFPAGL